MLATLFFASSLTLAYLSSQRSDAPESLLEGAQVVETAIDEAPVVDDEMPISEMPSLESAEDVTLAPASDGDLPALEEGVPADEDVE